MSVGGKIPGCMMVIGMVILISYIIGMVVKQTQIPAAPISTSLGTQVGVVQTSPGGVWWQVGVFCADGDRCWVAKDKPTIVDHSVTPTSGSARPTNFIRFVPLGTDHYMYLRADYYYPIEMGGEAVPNRKFPNGAVEVE